MTQHFIPIVAMLFALAVSAQVHETPAKKTIFIDIDEFESHSVSEGARLAAAVVRVRVVSSRMVTSTGSNGDIRPLTEHRCQIVDIYKDDSAHPLRVDDVIPILQNAGVYETPEARYVVGDDKPFSRGDELVLFLSWNRTFLAHETWKQLQFRVTGDRVEPIHRSIHEEQFSGLKIERLADEVRQPHGRTTPFGKMQVPGPTPIPPHGLADPENVAAATATATAASAFDVFIQSVGRKVSEVAARGDAGLRCSRCRRRRIFAVSLSLPARLHAD